MSILANIRMTPKLIGSFVLVALLAGVIGAAGLIGLTTMQTNLNGITGNAVPSAVALLQTDKDVNLDLRSVRGALLTHDPALTRSLVATATAAERDAAQQFQIYQSFPYSSVHEATVAGQAGRLLQQWVSLAVQISAKASLNTRASDAAAIALTIGPERALSNSLTSLLDELTRINLDSVTIATAQAQAAHNSALTELLIVIAVVLLLSVTLGVLLSRSIVRPLTEVQKAATSLAGICMVGLSDGIAALARGDLTVAAHVATKPPTYQSKDEIGQTAESMRLIIDRAQGAIGAYETARHQLQDLIGQVARSAVQVATGSQQLSTATEQMGQASTQISRAIEDVARGTSAQSHSATEALDQMTTLSDIVGQVATGTTQQQAAVAQADSAISQMTAALAHTSDGVTAVSQAADRAAQTATSGGAAVGQTIASIDSVRAAVLKSAEQVTILGQRSNEVGVIVKAIEEIAEQTNLLALNAAIEAARAGEHGKGFAVVAAEVRKLAERASSETKEISSRIGAIQTQVSDVVAAMQAGSQEVEQSATLGQQARTALQEILGVVEETRSQATAISSAVTQMSTSVEAVRSAAAHVAQIAGATGEATTQMSAGAERVNQAITEIAAVSQQSAAGAQEVSASTEEQTANVEEMAAGAQSLAQLAADLQAVVSQFVIDEALTAQRETTPPSSVTRTGPTTLHRVA